MRNTTETRGHPTEKSPQEHVIERLLEPEIVQLGARRAPDDEAGGCVWTFTPPIGEGRYWYFAVDEELAVGSFDFTLFEDRSFSCDVPDTFYFGSYSATMISYFKNSDEGADRTVRGSAWKHGLYSQKVRGKQRLVDTFVVLLPSALRRISLELHCDPVMLSSAIAALDGSETPAGLVVVLDDMRRAHPSAITASAYYQCKAVEACALILDWKIKRSIAPSLTIEACDLCALERSRAHLQEHLERRVSTRELCRVACMGPSKLITLFKEAHGTTPQEYARHVRMERACDLLAETKLTIAEISAQLGFARQGSFSEAFKKHTGSTPLAWRNAACQKR